MRLELAILMVATLPFIELRGAIPLAIAMGLEPRQAFLLGIVGNLLPIVPLLLLLTPVTEFLRVFTIFDRFFEWLHQRTIRQSDKVEKYGAFGLIFFTAIPIPTTGAWTATVAATLFRIRFKYAFPAISFGVLVAGVVVTFITIISSGG